MSGSSSSGDVGPVLAVDANVLLSSLLRGASLRVLTCPRLMFFTTLRTTWEVARSLPQIARRSALRGAWLGEAELEADLHRLPIIPLPDSFYGSCVARARELIERRDPSDIDILALTLKLDVPLWTNDRDLTDLAAIRTLTTAEMIALFLARRNDLG